MLTSSPAVGISGASSCKAVPAAPEIGQCPAAGCKAEIRPLGPMETQGTTKPRVCRRSEEEHIRQRKSTVKPVQQSTSEKFHLSTDTGLVTKQMLQLKMKWFCTLYQCGLLGSPKPALIFTPGN